MGVVIVHRAIATAGLQNAVVDGGVGHLRQHELRRANELLHADRKILDVIVVTLVSKTELAEASHMEPTSVKPAHVLSSGRNSIGGFDFETVTNAKCPGCRPRHHLLQIFKVHGARRMPAGALPVRKHVGVTVDDHRFCSGGRVRAAGT
jgi:hypothetical protein